MSRLATVGKPSLPPANCRPDVSLWHEAYFRLVIFKKWKIREVSAVTFPSLPKDLTKGLFLK